MALSLRQSQAINDIAEVLYDFLPGSGNASWKGHVSFSTISSKCGLGQFWQGGSKLPAIIGLLESTYLLRRSHFEHLIVEIVRAGITYRKRKHQPIRPDEINALKGHLIEIGFKFSELWDDEFVASLGLGSAERASRRVDEENKRTEFREAEALSHLQALTGLQQEFFALHAMESPQDAGRAFELVLNRLFQLQDLAPREPFRVVGEQIDGSFELDHETYLLEAKWEKSASSEAPLLIFRGKIEGKSIMTRGVFIALNGTTEQARQAIVTGKQATFFVIDGYDLTMILSGRISLIAFLRQRRRLLAEEGSVVVPFARLQLP